MISRHDWRVISLTVSLTAGIGLGLGLFFRHKESVSTQREIQSLAAENAILKIQNARRAEFSGESKGQFRNVDVPAATRASYDMGTPFSMLAAVRMFENGPPGYELGNQGKTYTWTQAVPRSDWQYYEASRTLNHLAWKYILEDSDRRREAISEISKTYTSKDHAKDWAKSVGIFEREVSQKITPKKKPRTRRK